MSAPPDVATVMSHLAELRREDGKTQEAIAREINVKHPRIESGRRAS